MECNCAESVINYPAEYDESGELLFKARTVSIGLGVHDCGYITWRNTLVPVAEREANAKYPEPLEPSKEERLQWVRQWNREFTCQMARLTHR